MPEPTNEPEKYSINDMLNRLNSRDNHEKEGELVTRADGSQALKVRKRKRRTNQIKDQVSDRNHRMQLLQIAGFIVFIVALLLIAGIALLYTNSKGFREDLLSKVEILTGSEAEIFQFRMNPLTASAGHLNMSWPDGYVLDRLETNGLLAKIAPVNFFGKAFKGEEIIATRGALFLKAPIQINQQQKTITKSEGDLISFNRYAIPKLNVFFAKEPQWNRMLENTEASFFPSLTQGQGEIRLNQGLLKFKNWPTLALDRAYINVRDDELHIQSMLFQAPTQKNQRVRDTGIMDIYGVMKPLEVGATHKLSVSLESFPLSHLLGNDLGQFFRGKTLTNPDTDSNYLEFTPGSGEEPRLELSVTNALDSRIDLMKFKFMGQLALTLDDRWYEFPSFDSKVKIPMVKRGETVGLNDIYLEQRGRMALRGTITSKGQGGQIAGKFSVGIPEAMIGASENRRIHAIFSEVNEGYRWIELEIGGTSAAPTDNFKDLYQAAEITTKSSGQNILESEDQPDTFESLIESSDE